MSRLINWNENFLIFYKLDNNFLIHLFFELKIDVIKFSYYKKSNMKNKIIYNYNIF